MCYVMGSKAIPDKTSLPAVCTKDHLNSQPYSVLNQTMTVLGKLVTESFCQAHYNVLCIRLLDREPDKVTEFH